MGGDNYTKPQILEDTEKVELKTFEFVSTSRVLAVSEEDAKKYFADNSIDFAANAECTEIE